MLSSSYFYPPSQMSLQPKLPKPSPDLVQALKSQNKFIQAQNESLKIQDEFFKIQIEFIIQEYQHTITKLTNAMASSTTESTNWNRKCGSTESDRKCARKWKWLSRIPSANLPTGIRNGLKESDRKNAPKWKWPPPLSNLHIGIENG